MTTTPNQILNDIDGPERPWGPDHDLATVVFQAVGAGSACWTNLAGAGEFDTTRAIEVAEELLAYLRGPHKDGPARIAATTEEVSP